jgi:hypothetical protein
MGWSQCVTCGHIQSQSHAISWVVNLTLSSSPSTLTSTMPESKSISFFRTNILRRKPNSSTIPHIPPLGQEVIGVDSCENAKPQPEESQAPHVTGSGLDSQRIVGQSIDEMVCQPPAFSVVMFSKLIWSIYPTHTSHQLINISPKFLIMKQRSGLFCMGILSVECRSARIAYNIYAVNYGTWRGNFRKPGVMVITVPSTVPLYQLPRWPLMTPQTRPNLICRALIQVLLHPTLMGRTISQFYHTRTTPSGVRDRTSGDFRPSGGR